MLMLSLTKGDDTVPHKKLLPALLLQVPVHRRDLRTLGFYRQVVLLPMNYLRVLPLLYYLRMNYHHEYLISSLEFLIYLCVIILIL